MLFMFSLLGLIPKKWGTIDVPPVPHLLTPLTTIWSGFDYDFGVDSTPKRGDPYELQKSGFSLIYIIKRVVLTMQFAIEFFKRI